MARFVGTNKNMFRDNQRAEGNFFKLLDAGVAFCFKHLSLSGRITNHSLEREEHLEVPYHALREALINALCHRHWERYNLTISLAIYDAVSYTHLDVYKRQILKITLTTFS